MLFAEASELQYLTDYKREDRRKLEMEFALPLTDTFSYEFLPENEREILYLEEFSDQRDSLTLWLMDSLSYKMDSLWVALSYTVKDTADRFVSQMDTLVFSYKEKTSGRRKRNETETVEKLEVKTIRNRGFQDLHTRLAFSLDFPLGKVTDSLISLFYIPDTVELELPFEVEADSLNLHRALLSAEWESASNYRLMVLPGAISSIYPLEHDTIDLRFETRDIEYYGKILLNLSQVQHRVLVQLLRGQNVISERVADADGQFVFPNLAPDEYAFKFIHDRNKNGKWDTGNYLEKKQPEAVEFLPGTIEVRSNWDHDVSMILRK